MLSFCRIMRDCKMCIGCKNISSSVRHPKSGQPALLTADLASGDWRRWNCSDCCRGNNKSSLLSVTKMLCSTPVRLPL